MHRFVKTTRCWTTAYCERCWQLDRLIPVAEGIQLSYLCKLCVKATIKPCFQNLWKRVLQEGSHVGEHSLLLQPYQAWAHLGRCLDYRYFSTPEEVKALTGHSLEAMVMQELDPVRGILRILGQGTKEEFQKQGYVEWAYSLLQYLPGENFH
jgi:hypothetical protein